MYWLLNSYKYLFAVLIILLFSACSSKKSEENQKPLIVCTTGMIGDAIKNIVGEHAEVQSIMGPGVDPHLYKATHGDLVKFQEADLIIYNGIHLEGKMGEVLEKLSRKKPVLAVGESIDKSDLINNTDFQGAYDPHIWFDISLWNKALNRLYPKIIEAISLPKEAISLNYKNYSRQLDSLDKSVSERILTIPAAQRKLVTAHDAFAYFGRAYDIEVRGLQGISTLSEFGLKDVSDLVAYIVKFQIPSIYTETSVSKKSIEAVIVGVQAKGFDVKLGGSLYSDAMGEKGSPEGTYIGMVDANVDKIVEGLKKPKKEEL